MPLKTDLLQTSLALLKDQKSEFSALFYQNLFADYPEVKPLFAHTNMEEQPKKLFASLVLVVENLKQPDTLTIKLKGLGSRHVKYGVLPKHYPMVGGSLLKSMAVILKENWTSEILEAWLEAYAVITEVMLEDSDYPEEILYPESYCCV